MIDIHCHILPECDDGAANMEESIAMARTAVQEGIHTIIATPHHKNGRYENTKQSIIQKVSELNAAIREESILLDILPGQELRIYGEILDDYSKGDILPLNCSSGYLFIEFPSSHVPLFAEQMLFDIQMRGLIPIIVHPERNAVLAENPDILYNFVKNGALTQLTASSVAGYFGKNVKKLSFQFIEANLAHFVASDAHNVSNRTFKMAEAFGQIEKKAGADICYLFNENAEMLVQGKPIYKEMPEKVKKKKFLGVF